MRRLRSVLRRGLLALRPEKLHDEIQQELGFHVDLKAEELIRGGMSPSEARRKAQLLFGTHWRMHEEGFEVRGGGAVSGLVRDISYALRLARKQPVRTLALILTLAVGVGVNTAVFSVLNGILLQPLPFPEGERLVTLHQANHQESGGVSYPIFRDWEANSRAFSGMAVYAASSATLTGAGAVQRVQGAVVSANLFQLVGVNPLRGRCFRKEEDRLREGGIRPVLISERLWHSRFDASKEVVGQRLVLDGLEYRVIGVLPEALAFPITQEPLDYWTTVAADAEPTLYGGTIPTSRGYPRYEGAVARLRPGATLPQAREQMDALAVRLAEEHPNATSMPRVQVHSTLEDVVGAVRPMLLLLYGSVGCVLLVATVNASGLMLVGTAGRARELSLRCALGAHPGMILRQVIVESLTLSLAAGGTGVLLGWMMMRLLVALAPAQTPRLAAIQLNAPVIGYAVAISMVAGLLSGLAPAFLAMRFDVMTSLRRGDIRSGRRPQAVRPGALAVMVQIAFSMLLTCCAALLAGSFAKLLNAPRGFDPEHVFTAQISLPPESYPLGSLKVTEFYRRLLQGLRESPGVESASAAQVLPLSGESNGTTMRIAHSIDAGRDEAGLRFIEPGYMSLMHIPLVDGRDFRAADRAGSAPCVLVNQAFVRAFLRGRPPLETSIELGWGGSGAKRIVGVVGDIRDNATSTRVEPEVYVPVAQFPVNDMAVLVRTRGETAQMAALLRRRVADSDPAIPVDRMRSLSDYRLLSAAPQRFLMWVLLLFSGSSLFLATIGLYATLSRWTAQRSREFGIRMALGSRAGQLVALVLREAGVIVLAGGAVGLVATLAGSRVLASWLYDTDPANMRALLTAGGILASISLLAAWRPARRAAEVDPRSSLAAE